MHIYNSLPVDWRDLENKVADILRECGLSAEVEKDIKTVRGNVNIDVYAEDNDHEPVAKYLFECKFWETDVNQSIVHSFRTVVTDYGANYGFIIAKKGFQSGAYEASSMTNIKLLSWFDFLDMFEEKWLIREIIKIDEICEPLADYTDMFATFFDVEYNNLSKEKQKLFVETSKSLWGIVNYSRCKYSIIDNVTKVRIRKNVFDNYVNKAMLNELKTYSITCYKDYFSALEQVCNDGVNFFDNLFGKKIRRKI